jgi:hypothetical protein
MRAVVGDGILVRGHYVADPDRKGVVLAVEGGEGAPPYLVRWDDGHKTTFFPGPDAVVEHLPAAIPQS